MLTGLWRLMKSGLSLFLILYFSKKFGAMIWYELNKMSFFPNQILNVLVNIAVLIMVICLLGRLNSSKWFQGLKNNFLAHLPFVGPAVKVYNQVEEIKDHAPEVAVELKDGIYALGWVSREWKTEKGIDMCEVQFPAHISPAGLSFPIRRDKLIFTGRKAGKSIVFTLSGGIAGDPPMKL